MSGDDHHCEWRGQVEHLKEDLGYAAQALDAAKQIIATQAETIRLKDEALARQAEQITHASASSKESIRPRAFRQTPASWTRFLSSICSHSGLLKLQPSSGSRISCPRWPPPSASAAGWTQVAMWMALAPVGA